MRTLIGFGSVVAATLALASACGGGQPESMVDGGAASSAGGNGNSAGTLALAGTLNGGGSSNTTGGTETSFGGDGEQSCAAATQQAELAAVYLVFLLDESGSMGDGKNGQRAQKWDPVTSALNAFYADPDSAGITASLSLFPQNLNKTMGAADQSKPADCNKSAYDKPEVPPRALPDAKTFAAAIATLDPPNEFGTPTFPALSGTIDYAETLLKEDASRKVAIVMVTDGEPYGCDGNTIDATAAAAKKVAARIPTYVIGVGDQLDSLNAIAKGGGTDKAFIVALANPEQTRKDLLGAINLIRGKSISCDLAIPPPPAGKKLDPNKVNVQFTGNGQTGTSLQYGETCTGDTAWHYDDPQAPKSILLCDATCTAVKADPMGKLAVEFGCEDRVPVVQ
jgi:hypothetical protein